MGDSKEPLCPTCSSNPEIQDKYERMKKQMSNTGPPKLKGSGFYVNDYINGKDRKTKSIYDIERKKEEVLEKMNKDASKAFPEAKKTKPIPSQKITNMSWNDRVIDNVDPDAGPIIKRRNGHEDKL